MNLLAELLLREPDEALIRRAVDELGFPLADPAELAVAYTDLFLLNIPPYGSVFLDESGELGGPSAERLAEAFRAAGFEPRELSEVAAPDHLGLLLEFVSVSGSQVLGGYDASWIVPACIAVGREPGVHPFYRALATETRRVTSAIPPPDGEPARWRSPLELRDTDDEVTLGRVVRFLLAPARSGVFLSRGRFGTIARALGLALPFGSRFEVARALFFGAGEAVEGLLDALDADVDAWCAEYRETGLIGQKWLDAAHRTKSVLREMRSQVDS